MFFRKNQKEYESLVVGVVPKMKVISCHFPKDLVGVAYAQLRLLTKEVQYLVESSDAYY